MKGSRFVLISGIVLALYGAVNSIYCIILWLGAKSYDDALLSFDQLGIVLLAYLIINGLIPFIVGGLGIFWHNRMDKTKVVYVLAWILLIVEYGLFFTTYGKDVFTIIFSLGSVIVSLIYYYGADKNLREQKQFYKEHNI